MIFKSGKTHRADVLLYFQFYGSIEQETSGQLQVLGLMLSLKITSTVELSKKKIVE